MRNSASIQQRGIRLPRQILGIIIVLAALGSAPGNANAQSATFQNLGQLSGSPALPNGVSADGKVVTGYLYGNPNQAFSWAGGTITPLGFLSGYATESRGTAINSDGSVITGWSRNSSSEQAFRWVGNSLTGIGALSDGTCDSNTAPPYSAANAINADGSVIAGQSRDNSLCNGDGFRWVNGQTMQALVCPISICFQNNATGVSGDGSVVVGSASQSGDLSGAAWRWANGNFNIFAGPFGPSCTGSSAYVNGVTPDGNIVFGTITFKNSQCQVQPTQAFLWNNSTNHMTLLGQLPGTNSILGGVAVNADGTVVVGQASSGNGVVFRWTAASGMQRLDALLAQGGANVSGWAITTVTGISADGTVIVGSGAGPCNCAAGWIATLPVTATLYGVNTHDFDDDHKSDILWRDTSGNVAMWLMNGGSVSSSVFVGNVPGTWNVVGQRDFDGDAKADILWRDSSGNTAIWLMNGGTVASTVFIGNVGTSWSVAGTGDFNNDSKGDILWRDTSGNVAIWLMDGGTISSSVFVGNVATSWTIAGSSGNTIVWRDTAGDIALWKMNGGSIAQSISLGNVSPTWSIVGAGDFNGDGNADILWRDSSGTVAVWLLNANGTVASSVVVSSIATAWSIIETGDFNGDGKSDILWRDSSGNNAIWFMNGGTVSSIASLGNIPTVWSMQGANAD